MEIIEIENIYKLIEDYKVSEQEKIDGIKATYDLNELYDECLDKDLYTDQATQYYLTVIKDKLDSWNEKELITLNKKTK